MRKIRKRAITFAELMISLVVISVIAAILYPTIAQFTPNVNKPLFKAAHSTLSTVLIEIVSAEPTGKIADYTITSTTEADGSTTKTVTVNEQIELCEEFCKIANVVPETIGDATKSECNNYCNDDVITTTNGMRWRFYEFGATWDNPAYLGDKIAPPAYKILVDVNASNNKLKPAKNVGDNFKTGYNGVFYYTSDANKDTGIYSTLPTIGNPQGTFVLDRLKSQDTFIILVNEYGKIIAMSPAGWAHLEDLSAD